MKTYIMAWSRNRKQLYTSSYSWHQSAGKPNRKNEMKKITPHVRRSLPELFDVKKMNERRWLVNYGEQFMTSRLTLASHYGT